MRLNPIYLILASIGLAILCGGLGLWWDQSLLGANASAAATMLLKTQRQIQIHQGQPLEITVEGENLDGTIQGWIVPETNQRQAIIGTLTTWGHPLDVVRREQVAFLANGAEGILIIEVRDGSPPKALGAFQTSSQALKIRLDGALAYIACGQTGLQVLDISDQTKPRLVSALSLPGPVLGLAVAKPGLLLASSTKGIHTIDVADPAHPVLLASLDLAGPAMDIVMVRGYALVALNKNGAAVIDISNPSLPFRVSQISQEGLVNSVAATGQLALVGTSLLHGAGGNLCMLDLSVPNQPRIVGNITLPGSPLNMTVTDSRAAVSLSGNGLWVVNFEDPGHPHLETTFNAAGSTKSAVLMENKAWIADGTGHFLEVNLKQDITPPILSNLPVPPLALSPIVSDALLLLPEINNRLQLFDIADPRNPNPLGSLETSGRIRALAFQNPLAAISFQTSAEEAKGSILLADTSDPFEPDILSRLDLPSLAKSVALTHNRLVVAQDAGDKHPDLSQSPAERESELQVFDISAPRQPRLIRSIPIGGKILSLAADGKVGFALSSRGEFTTFDLSERPRQGVLSTIGMPWLYQGATPDRSEIILFQGLALVSSGISEIKVIDVADPNHPALLGQIDVGGNLGRMALDADRLFVSVSGEGIKLFDLSVPLAPEFIGTLPIAGQYREFAAAQQLLWIGAQSKFGVNSFLQPYPVSVKTTLDSTAVAVKIPALSDRGDYTLWLKRGEEREILPACLRINSN